MAIVVQKFGGTSVNTAEKREKVLNKVIIEKNKGHDVVVVISAMGRKGEPYATDTLLDLLKQIGPNPLPQTKDLLVSCGEIISACVKAHSLEQRGYKAVAMTGFQAGIITDNNFTNANIKRINTERIKRKLEEGFIVIVAGFQGITEAGEITTLGRGGSDTTALALGGALGAQETIIYTDVPGVAFVDPHLIPASPFMNSIDFASMYILARAGAKVIHLRAVKTALDFQCPFYVRSSFQDGKGTLIGPKGETYNGIYGLAVLRDVALLKLPSQKADQDVRKLAVDEMFIKEEAGGLSLVLPAEQLEAVKPAEGSVTEGVELITMVWDPQSGLTAGKFGTLLEQNGIPVLETFVMPAGASWLVPAVAAFQALQVLFAYAHGE